MVKAFVRVKEGLICYLNFASGKSVCGSELEMNWSESQEISSKTVAVIQNSSDEDQD